MEINQQNPMAFTMGFHNDLPMMFGLTMAFTIDFPMMFPMENHPKSWFLPWIEHDGNLQAFGFLPVLWDPQKARKPKPKDGPKMWCLKLRIPKMTVFLLGKMMINKITSNFRSTLIMFPKKKCPDKHEYFASCSEFPDRHETC